MSKTNRRFCLLLSRRAVGAAGLLALFSGVLLACGCDDRRSTQPDEFAAAQAGYSNSPHGPTHGSGHLAAPIIDTDIVHGAVTGPGAPRDLLAEGGDGLTRLPDDAPEPGPEKDRLAEPVTLTPETLAHASAAAALPDANMPLDDDPHDMAVDASQDAAGQTVDAPDDTKATIFRTEADQAARERKHRLLQQDAGPANDALDTGVK